MHVNVERKRPRRPWATLRRHQAAYLFISPFYVLWLIFGLFPLLWSLYLSGQQWDGFGKMRSAGLSNYAGILRDGVFWQAVRNTLYLWWGHIVIMFVLALLLAVLLNLKRLRGKTFFRTVVFSPFVMGTAAISLVFGLVFDKDYGPLNAFLGLFGIAPVPWLISPDYTKPAVIIFNIWQITGFWVLLLLAGMQGIDTTLYEAAMIDGANAWQRFWHITIPGLIPVLFFCFIMETMGSIRIFTQPFILLRGGGGPGRSALTITMYLYNSAFAEYRFGYAAAVGWVLFALLVVVSAIQVRVAYRQALEIA